MTDFAVTATPMPPAAAPAPAARIATLDIVRGIAVMGILAMNIVAFAMPFQAYMNPTAYGMESGADLASWAFNFVFIDGKMRGLFSFLFGASTLLVIERAQAAGMSPARVHYARMIWLLVFGLIHFYFIWFGDILTLYALTGLVLFFFRRLSVRALVISGIAFVAVQSLVFGAIGASAVYLSHAAVQPGAPAEMVEGWRSMQQGFTPLAGQALSHKLALFQGPYAGLVHKRLIENGLEPFTGIFLFGWETLGYMLLGMAALKSGFFRGEWPGARYRKWALIGFGIGVPVYAALAFALVRANFSVEMIFALSMAATTPFRPLMIVAIAALIVLLTRNGGALVDRIAAAGRAAFTNYLGTSILMTSFFYGYGLGFYGTMSRIELWLVVVAMWALMLLWSKPWLDRYRYGPFEWLWRSLARMELQPMRKAA
ncbi:MAG: uncharacterized protein QOG13_1042 [Sphingomonadales bacterium]|jgi:uncharacterized protein|nr:uncharacterized protein [Sphingomonadales bacterium]MEA3045539.1 uncharacterized protein [Sphingomonadales bacterium]